MKNLKKINNLIFLLAIFLFAFTACQKEPTASFIASKSSVEVGESIMFNNTSKDGDNYEWDFGDGSMKSTSENPIHTYSEAGTYIVTLTAFSKNGRKSDKASTTIEVKEPPQQAGSFVYDGKEYEFTYGFLEYYEDCGNNTHVIDLILLSSGFDFIEYGGEIVDITGEGDLLYFEMFSSLQTGLSSGTYNFTNDYCESFSFSDYNEFIVGLDLENETFDFYVEEMTGTIQVTRNGSNYTISFDLICPNQKTFTGTFEGNITFLDYDKKSSRLLSNYRIKNKR